MRIWKCIPERTAVDSRSEIVKWDLPLDSDQRLSRTFDKLPDHGLAHSSIVPALRRLYDHFHVSTDVLCRLAPLPQTLLSRPDCMLDSYLSFLIITCCHILWRSNRHCRWPRSPLKSGLSFMHESTMPMPNPARDIDSATRSWQRETQWSQKRLTFQGRLHTGLEVQYMCQQDLNFRLVRTQHLGEPSQIWLWQRF